MPLRGQSALGLHTGAQPVAIPHHFLHTRQRNRDHRQEGGWRFLSLVNEGVSAPNFR